jgi:CheY-like chemotaxis protein
MVEVSVDNATNVLTPAWSATNLIDSLTDRSQIFLFTYSPQYRSMLSWSKNAPRVLGVSDPSIARDRMLFLRHVHPDDRLFLLSELARSLKERREFVVTYRWIRPDSGEIRMLHCRASNSTRPDDPVFEGVILDISNEFPSAMGRAGEQHFLDQYLSLDFTKSLQAIAVQAGKIQANANDPKLVAAAAAEIQKAIEKTSNLQSLVQQTKKEAESVKPADLDLLDLNVLVMSAVNRVDDLCSAGMKIAATFGDPARVMGHAELLIDTIEIVLRDARSSMPEGGMLTIKTSQARIETYEIKDMAAGSYAKLVINYNSVNGLEADRRKVQAFQQNARVVRGRPYDSMREHWLALSKAIAILQRFGGSLTVERFAWSGINICIYLPLAERNGLSSPDRLFIPDMTNPPRILIIDDDLVVLRAIDDHLKELGHVAVVAEDYSRAINLMKSYRTSLDIVILDTYIRGFDEVKTVRSLKRLKNEIQVIGFGDADDVSFSQLFDAGVVEFLPKPLERLRLQNSIVKAFDLSRNRKAA